MRRLRRWWLTAAALAMAAGGGCSDAPEAHPKGVGAARPADPLANAPTEWGQFLEWARDELGKTPAPVPLPQDPTFPAPRWSVIRLDQELPRALTESDWEASDQESAALVELGPFRSDAPTTDFATAPNRSTGNLALLFRGFRVEREQVGSLRFDLRVPYGEHIEVIWDRGGKISVPLPDNEEFWTLRVATDGFARWEGPLEQLRIETDGTGEGVIEVRSIAFLPPENSFPDAVGARKVALGRQLRSAVYAHGTSTVRYERVTVPERGSMLVGLGRGGIVEQPVTFEVAVIPPEGDERVVLDRSVPAGEGTWQDVAVSLDEWAGQTVALALRTRSPSSETVGLWGTPTIHERVEDPPLLVIYLIDTLAAGHLNLYGAARETAPRLSAFAREGVLFRNAFCNSPQTVASVPDLMLSMPTERHGIHSASIAAPEALVTLAESLQAAGFATASFITNVNAGPRQRMDQGFDALFDHVSFMWDEVDRTVPIEEVLAWAEDRRDRPMFLYVHTAEPHAPYAPPPGFAGRFATGYSGPLDGTLDPRTGFRRARTPEEIAHVASLYDEEALYADHRLGLFVDALEEAGLRDRATFFVVSDHGEEFLQHGFWGHGNNLYDPVLRIPFVAFGSRVAARGGVEHPAQLYDLMPTVLDLFELPAPYLLEGRSLAPLLAGSAPNGTDSAPPAVISTNHEHLSAGVVEHSIVEGPWKLMHRLERSGAAPSTFELFNVAGDPFERENVIDQQKDLARRLIGRLLVYHARQRPHARDMDLEFDPEQLRELQGMGYIQSD